MGSSLGRAKEVAALVDAAARLRPVIEKRRRIQRFPGGATGWIASVMAMHISSNWDAVCTMYGRFALGLDPEGAHH